MYSLHGEICKLTRLSFVGREEKEKREGKKRGGYIPQIPILPQRLLLLSRELRQNEVIERKRIALIRFENETVFDE
jgi:hypothetical protein